jgi:hypothetical protein
VVPTVWNNCSRSRIFHASPQDNISGQTDFSRSPDHAIPDYFLRVYVTSKVYRTCPAIIAEIKQ